MSEAPVPRPTSFVRLAASAALAAFACSRTDSPREHYASGTVNPGAGGALTGSSGGAASNGAAPASGSGGQAASSGRGNVDPGAGRTPVNEAGHGGDSGDSAGGADGGDDVPLDYGCGPNPVSEGDFTRAALRAAAADCASFHQCRFEGGAKKLRDELERYAEAPTSDALRTARDAFTTAMSLWSVAELFQFGPVASSSVASGKDVYQGQGLRESIHAWPLTGRCRVEEQVINQRYATDFPAVLVTGRGLFALDYLLYYAGRDSECAASSVITKTWLTLDEEELSERKVAYAAALGQNILESASNIRATWTASGGDFRARFVAAEGYPSEPEAMKTLGWSLLYVEREVKDWKVGIPAGYTLTAPVTLQESPYSGLLSTNVSANLRGFRSSFEGCGPDGEGLGFDDWLRAAGHPELAQEIHEAWRSAQLVADAMPRFAEATPGQIETLYRAIKGLTDLLKNDLFAAGSPLGLSLPPGIEGDTD